MVTALVIVSGVAVFWFAMWWSASSDADYHRGLVAETSRELVQSRSDYRRLKDKIENLAVTAGIIDSDED